MGSNKSYQVFISYRREGGAFFSRLVYDRLVNEGYRVFLDVEVSHPGKFNEELLRVIEQCPYFICVLPPNALDRCYNEGDWVRTEIAHAIRLNKCIIPVMLQGFEFPADLPEDIAEIRNYQAIRAIDTETFPADMEKLLSYLGRTPAKDRRRDKASMDERLRHLDLYVLLLLGFYMGLFLLIKRFYTSPPWMPGFLDAFLTQEAQTGVWLRAAVLALMYLGYKWYMANNEDYNRAMNAGRLLAPDDLRGSPEDLLKTLTGICPEEVSREKDAPEGTASVFARYRAFEHLEIGSTDGSSVDYLLIRNYRELSPHLCVFCLSGWTVRSASARILLDQGFILSDGRDRDVARFRNSEFELDVLYGSFGLNIIGLELRRGVEGFSRLTEANREQKEGSAERVLMNAEEKLQRKLKDLEAKLEKGEKEGSGDGPSGQAPGDGDDEDPSQP